jgi:hypothetical protein
MAKKKKTAEEEIAAAEEAADPFEEFLGMGAAEEDPAEEVEEEAEEAPGGEKDSAEASSAGDDEKEDGEEGDVEKPERLEAREQHYEEVERENLALRRKLYAKRERDRIAAEKERLEATRAEAEETDIDADEVGHWEGDKFVFDREKLNEKMAAHRQRRQVAEPPQVEKYEVMRDAIIDEQPEENRDSAREAAEELETAYRWLDSQVDAFCKEAGVNPNDIGGMPALMALLSETGILDDFEKKYEDIPVTELITAPTDPRLMKRTLRNHMRRRTMSDVTDYEDESGEEKEEVIAPPKKRRPRPMHRKGKARSNDESTSLTDVDPVSIFDMSDEEYRQHEARSLKNLERS